MYSTEKSKATEIKDNMKFKNLVRGGYMRKQGIRVLAKTEVSNKKPTPITKAKESRWESIEYRKPLPFPGAKSQIVFRALLALKKIPVEAYIRTATPNAVANVPESGVPRFPIIPSTIKAPFSPRKALKYSNAWLFTSPFPEK